MPYLEAVSSKPCSLRYMDLEESKYLPKDADFHQTGSYKYFSLCFCYRLTCKFSSFHAGPHGASHIVCACGLSSSSRCSWLCWWWLGPSRLWALSLAGGFFSCLLLPACLSTNNLITEMGSAHLLTHTSTLTYGYPHSLSQSNISWLCWQSCS